MDLKKRLLGTNNIMPESKLVCVLFNAGKNNALTQQSQERIQAGLAFKNSTLCFVGAKTWLMKTVCPNNKTVIELNNCNNTAGNIREISKFTKNNNFTEIIIISHYYHLRRIGILLKIFGLNANLVACEDIIKIKKRKSLLEYGLILGTKLYQFSRPTKKIFCLILFL